VDGGCAQEPVEAVDEEVTVVDSLPEGTCHVSETVEWSITDS
jgi:uncharacterized repeat protein (TIGR01451 family)